MGLEDYGFIKIWVPAPGRPGARPDNGIQPLPGRSVQLKADIGIYKKWEKLMKL